MRTLFLLGPTAVGKSAVALALAPALDAEIVSADSMQVYRGLDIGTAKPSAADRQAVPHHLLDVADPDAVFDVKRFLDLAGPAIADIHARGRIALVVGGSGLYVRALRHGLFAGPARNAALRARLESLAAPELFAELQRADPAAAASIDRHNPRRLVRALEVFHATGRSIRELQREWNGQGAEVSGQKSEVSGQKSEVSGEAAVCLTRARDDLYARIEARIEAQLDAGWLAEARALLARRVPAGATALQAAGYRELAAHLRGECPLAAAVQQIKTRTRQLARRQLTWFRREPGVRWVEVPRDEPAAVTAQRIREATRTLEDV